MIKILSYNYKLFTWEQLSLGTNRGLTTFGRRQQSPRAHGRMSDEIIRHLSIHWKMKSIQESLEGSDLDNNYEHYFFERKRYFFKTVFQNWMRQNPVCSNVYFVLINITVLFLLRFVSVWFSFWLWSQLHRICDGFPVWYYDILLLIDGLPCATLCQHCNKAAMDIQS